MSKVLVSTTELFQLAELSLSLSLSLILIIAGNFGSFVFVESLGEDLNGRWAAAAAAAASLHVIHFIRFGPIDFRVVEYMSNRPVPIARIGLNQCCSMTGHTDNCLQGIKSIRSNQETQPTANTNLLLTHRPVNQ